MHIYLPEELYKAINSNSSWYRDELGAKGIAFTERAITSLIERTYFLCWYLITRNLFPTKKRNGSKEKKSLLELVNISSSDLKHYGSKHYVLIIKFLKTNNIVETSEKYSTGQNGTGSFTKSYQFLNKMQGSSSLVKVELSDAHLVNKIKKHNIPDNLPEYLIRYKDEVLNKIYLDHEAEDSLVVMYNKGQSNILDFYRSSYQIFKTQMGFYLKTDNQGRLYHPFNGMKNDLRKFLKINGYHEDANDWVEVDVSSCYPFIFSSYLINKGHTGKDLLEFHELSKSGSFYQDLLKYCIEALDYDIMRNGIKEAQEPRDELMGKYLDKKELLKKAVLTIFNKTPKRNLSTKNRHLTLYQTIKEKFPTVLEQVDLLNKDKNNIIHHIITHIESSIMVDFFIPQILERQIICITRHDGVICLDKDAKEVKEIMEEGFRQELGLLPHIKFEKISDKNKLIIADPFN